MESEKYIIPTKEKPIFVASCDWFGYIEVTRWKDYLVETPDRGSIGRTFDLHFKQAVNNLHEWIQENPQILKEYPKAKFEILLVDGTWDKFNQSIQKNVYSITAQKALMLLF